MIDSGSIRTLGPTHRAQSLNQSGSATVGIAKTDFQQP